MIKLAIEGASLASFAVIGLLLFVSIFVGVSIWAFTRRSNQLAGWSSMPLTDGNIFNVPNTTPSAPQVSIPKAQSSQNNIQLDLVNFDQEGQKISCGKCEIALATKKTKPSCLVLCLFIKNLYFII